MNTSIFDSEFAIKSCQGMYRVGGLSHLLKFLLELLGGRLNICRINAAYSYKRGLGVVNVADTSDTFVPNKFSEDGSTPAFLLPSHFENPLIINNLRPYQREFKKVCGAGWENTPFLHHLSLIRLPMQIMDGTGFFLNFWSNSLNNFQNENIQDLLHLLSLVKEDFKTILFDFDFTSESTSTPVISGKEKLNIGTGLNSVKKIVEEVAPTDCPVLIIGETGTGKEVIADAVYELSQRKNRPFIKINCGSLQENLIESELFGHEKGSFTGAIETHKGLFEQANGGTLFLDEVGELPLSMQVHLLRVLDTNIIRRVGGTKDILLNIRIIAASHSVLKKVREGSFRKDLWYRLSVMTIFLPPLRERPEDIPVLLRYFIAQKARKLKLNYTPKIVGSELQRVISYPWPGNIRELEHSVERSLIKNKIDKNANGLRIELLPEINQDDTQENKISSPVINENIYHNWPTLNELEARYIKKVLEHCGKKLTGTGSATDILKIHYTTLKAKMKLYGIQSVK